MDHWDQVGSPTPTYILHHIHHYAFSKAFQAVDAGTIVYMGLGIKKGGGEQQRGPLSPFFTISEQKVGILNVQIEFMSFVFELAKQPRNFRGE